MAAGALNFASGKLLITLQVLLALGAGEFELAHESFRMGVPHHVKNNQRLQSFRCSAGVLACEFLHRPGARMPARNWSGANAAPMNCSRQCAFSTMNMSSDTVSGSRRKPQAAKNFLMSFGLKEPSRIDFSISGFHGTEKS